MHDKPNIDSQKIGIMGGSFNPFHHGHLRHAIEVADKLELDFVEILPSAYHPHKKGLLPFDLRVSYAEAATRSIKNIYVNVLESELSPPSYTDKILKEWRIRKPNTHPYFLLGTEDFAVLETWHNGFELAKHAHLVIVSRHDSANDQTSVPVARLVCEHAKRYWGNFYISSKDLCDTANSVINNVSDLDNIQNNIPCSEQILEKYYEKFDSNTQKICFENLEKLHIAIPNLGYCTYLHIPHLDISATQIRKLWREKKYLHGLIPESVLTLLEKDQETLDKYW